MSTALPPLNSRPLPGLRARRNPIGSSGLLSGLFAVFLMATILSVSSALLRPENIHLAIGMLALLIVAIPVVTSRNYDLFSPWSFIVLSVFLGSTLRGFYMSFNLPDAETADFFWHMGNPPEYFWWPYCVLLLGLASLSTGYMTATRRTSVPLPAVAWKDQRVVTLGVGVMLLAAFATVRFIGNTNGAASGKISAKRTVHAYDDVLGTSENHAHGALRKGAQLAFLGHILLLAAVFSRRSAFRSVELFLMLGLLLIGCVLPFYASSRSGMAYGLMQSLAVVYYSKRHISMGRIVWFGVVGVIGLLLFMVVTQLRMWGELGQFSLLGAVDSVVVNRNCCGCAKVAHVVNAVPELLDYEYGRTIWVWIFAPIPRSMWAAKPLMHSGPIIGSTIFGSVRGGVPVSLIGELYWNFALPGVVIGCFLVGVVIKHIYLFIRPERGGDLRRAVIYAFGPMMIGFQTLGTNVGFGFFNSLLQGCLAFLAVSLVGSRLRKHAARRIRTPSTIRSTGSWQARPAVSALRVTGRNRS